MGGHAEERPWLRQHEWDVRLEWGPVGAATVRSDAVVVIDVLRFTTAVDAAVGRGATVFPYRWKDGSAAGFAREVGAVLAGPGGEPGLSLSPISLLALGPGDRVVLPSPNGSTCAAVAAEHGAEVVVAACLRNATAVARWLDRQRAVRTVTVIAGGERWPDGTLRPALEDHLGAGAVVAALADTLSPEARAAADLWHATAPRVAAAIADCASGREQVARGWDGDLRYATEVDASATVPVLRDGAFVDAADQP
ncbi:MAG: 2-phosphosulfolactate phosphatase [Actinomycetota bacterium]|nr:2-phosphosulfolactate phosphatase [Actinomycetota bacterium]